MRYILAPSILSADFSKLAEELNLIENAGALYTHIDVMDGKFVPNITLGPPVVSSIRKCAASTFDVHLMIDEPAFYISDFAKAGADIITVHYEASRHLDRTIYAIHEKGIKAGVALNPATNVHFLKDILPTLDMVLLMSVNPGFGGQKFIPYVIKKIRELKAMISEAGRDIDIEVDGGINLQNVKMIKEAGANIFVVGTAIFNGDIENNIKEFLKIIV